MRVDRLSEVVVAEVAAFVAGLQNDPTHHVCYLGDDAAGVADQLRELEPAGLAGTLVASSDGGAVLGVLGAEWDTDPPRVWWHGPSVRDGEGWDAIADRLYVAACGLLPAAVTEQELAPDERNARVAAFAARHGFTREVASAVLSRHLTSQPSAVSHAPGVEVVALGPAHRDEIRELHDASFPGTHLPGTKLVEPAHDRITLVASRDGTVVGYVAAEVQEAGEGYLDYLGVDPVVRRRGIGGLLVEAACDELREAGCPVVHLTVREDNAAARSLYAQLGFTEERVLVPWRRGFGVS